ncbi:ankyrin-2-like [Pecten maximus]|uniref:ankyrin-2-like n=1 Tax=Pecten maximus TaxID=6579 RepID=UPI001457E8F8|nr:ankyrin-2-like [Pecten maximus]
MDREKKMNVIEFKRYQSELYESIMSRDPNCMELVKKYEEIIQKEIEINVGSLCRCGREIEHHFIQEPHQSKPAIDKISEMIRRGECKCGYDGPGYRKDGVVRLTFVHIAASSNNVELLRLLSSHTHLFKQHTWMMNLSPIFIAVTLRNEEAIDFLLTQDIDINAVCTSDRLTVLMRAVQQKKVNLVKRLLQFPGIDINIKSLREETPTSLALRWQSKEIFDILIDTGADINVTPGAGATSLLMIAITKGMEYVTKLLEKGVDVNYTNPRNETAMHYAVYVDNVNAVQALLDANADPNVRVKSDLMTPIVFAANQGETAVVEVLAKGGADINLSSVQGYNAVHMAAWNGYTAMLKSLLECEGVEHDKVTCDKNSPLGLACHGNHAVAVEMLLPRGCNVNNQDKDNDTALLYATYNGMTDTVRLLLQHGADPDLWNSTNVSPLWNAVYGKHREIVKLLLGANVKLEVSSIGTNQHSHSNDPVPLFPSPKTTLYVAVRNECTDIVYLLLSAGYNINREQWLQMEECPELEQQANIVAMLRKKASQPPRLISICRNYFRGYGNPRELTELVKALDLPRYLKNYLLLTELLTDSCLKLLISSFGKKMSQTERKAMIDKEEMDKIEIRRCQSELYGSIMSRDPNCMELVKKYDEIIQKEIKICVGSLCRCGREIEHHFIQEPHQSKPAIDKISEMIRRGECKCGYDGPGYRKDGVVRLTFVHIAVSSNNVELLRLLSSHTHLFKQHTWLMNLSPIFIAVALKNEEAIDFLLTQDIDINAVCTSDRLTVLMRAVQHNKVNLVQRLLQVPGIDINKKSLRGDNPATLSLRSQSKEIFDMLIEAGADINITGGKGETSLLMKAIVYGINYVIKLLEKGVNVNYTNPRNETALHFAVYAGNAHTVQALVDANADPNVGVKSNQRTPIIIAALRGYTAAVEVLAKGGADINLSSVPGYNAVHMASWNGYTAMLKSLLECEGVEHDKVTCDKNSPLGLACHRNHAAAVEMLLPRGCNVNNQDKDNDTALLYATYNGMTDTVRLLLQHGADPDLWNSTNVSPLWNAVYGKHREIVKLLLGANVKLEVSSIGTNQHSHSNDPVPLFPSPKTTLYVAVRNECTDIVYLLLSAGYNINREQWLQMEECPELEQQANIVAMLRKKASQPPRLISICRNYFRGYGNPRELKELVKALDLPRYLKNYLLLTELLTDSCN